MFTEGLAGILLTVCAASFAADKPGDGFVSLFNGRDLTGWAVMGSPKGWTIRNGRIRSDGAMGGDWLRSERQYGDFIFRADWRISKSSNSSLFVRAGEKGHPAFTGYPVQISTQSDDEEHCTGSLYDLVKVKRRPDETPDKWHTLEVRCQGNRIEVVADGVKCIDHVQSTSPKTKNKPLRGFLGLQECHSPRGRYVEFRNLQVKTLD